MIRVNFIKHLLEMINVFLVVVGWHSVELLPKRINLMPQFPLPIDLETLIGLDSMQQSHFYRCIGEPEQLCSQHNNLCSFLSHIHASPWLLFLFRCWGGRWSCTVSHMRWLLNIFFIYPIGEALPIPTNFICSSWIWSQNLEKPSAHRYAYR